MASANVGICATVAAIAVCNIAVEPAHAESFWRQLRPFFGYHAPMRHKHPPRDKPPVLKKQITAQEKSALQIIVSIANQRISVYDGDTLIAHSSVSTGVPEHPTPTGIFSVIGKHIWHRSNLYSAAPMPYMQRITWSGIALHAGDLPGYPASHGCIRLERSFAIRLWHLTKRGTRVIITPSDVRPIEIASPHLPVFKPKAPDAPPKTAALISEAAVSDAAVGSSLSTPTDDPSPIISEVPGSPPSGVAARKPAPISIFVSRKSNTLFVRQNFKSLFETPVTIQDPEEPLGTHVFTLMGPRGEATDLKWTVVSIPEGSPRVSQISARRQRSTVRQMAETAPPVSSPEKAHTALSRIAIPPDAVERIAELMAPGSALILSDQGISKETGQNTDFIVETP